MRVVKLLVAAGLVWTLYWAVAAWGLRSGIAQWFVEQERQGWLADYVALETSGFPVHHTTRILRPALADPGTGAAWSSGWISLHSPVLRPGHLTLKFAPSAQRLSHFDRTAVLRAADMEARMQLTPGSAMTLERLSLQSGLWLLSDGADELLKAPSFGFEMTQSSHPDSYNISATTESLVPLGTLRQLLVASDDFPNDLSGISVDAEVRFDTSWDRTAIELRRPQPRRIALRLAQAHWGALSLKAAGTVEIDEAGRASGQLMLKAENWHGLLKMAERSGLLPARLRARTERILGVLASMEGGEEDLEITLSLKVGRMFLGPLPLGEAPRIALR